MINRDGWLYAWAIASVALGAGSLLVPLYFVAIGGETFMLGVLAGVAAAAGAPGALIFGRVADKTGKRRSLVLLALGLATLALVLVSLTERPWLVIVGNGLLWFAAALTTSASQEEPVGMLNFVGMAVALVALPAPVLIKMVGVRKAKHFAEPPADTAEPTATTDAAE